MACKAINVKKVRKAAKKYRNKKKTMSHNSSHKSGAY